jgi:glycine C-acetyltransferase
MDGGVLEGASPGPARLLARCRTAVKNTRQAGAATASCGEGHALFDGERRLLGRMAARRHASSPGRSRACAASACVAGIGATRPCAGSMRCSENSAAILYIDDAHATGILGRNGGGTSEHFNCYSPNIIQMGTLSKALGSIGGFVAVESDVADVIRLTSSAYGFTCPPPPDQAAALIAALDLLVEEPERRQRLWDNQRYFVEKMARLGLTMMSTPTPIVPVLIGEAERCLAHARALKKEGIHVDSVQFPAAPVGKARLRFMMNAGHTREQIDHVVDVLRRLGG